MILAVTSPTIRFHSIILEESKKFRRTKTYTLTTWGSKQKKSRGYMRL